MQSSSSTSSAVPNVKAGSLCSGASGPYPYPDDCTKFVTCDSTGEHITTCPSGLKYNDQIKACDWPNNVVCSTIQPITTTTTTLQVTSSSTPKPTVTTTTTSASLSSSSSSSSKTIQELCSSGNGIYPNPSNCNQFYQCGSGSPFLMSCAPGLNFDPVNKICNWLSAVTCSTSFI